MPWPKKKCSIEGCYEKTAGRGWCMKHYYRWRRNGDPLKGKDINKKHKRGEGTIDKNGYHREMDNGKEKFSHVIIIEKILGRKFPIGSVTHHVDGNKLNNINSNLVLCDSIKYHFLLHSRTRALKSCGHANWPKCVRCLQYDDPKNMYIHPTKTYAYHRKCQNIYQLNRRKNNALAKKTI